MNGKQETTPLTNPNAAAPALQPEIETDTKGETTVVERARHMQHEIPAEGPHTDTGLRSKPSTAPEEAGKKMVENKDKNFDVTPSRYPNAHPDNHQNRGNIEPQE